MTSPPRRSVRVLILRGYGYSMAGLNRKEFSIRRAFDFDSGVHFVRPMLMAIVVGVGTGFLVVAFIKSILWMTAFLF